MMTQKTSLPDQILNQNRNQNQNAFTKLNQFYCKIFGSLYRPRLAVLFPVLVLSPFLVEKVLSCNSGTLWVLLGSEFRFVLGEAEEKSNNMKSGDMQIIGSLLYLVTVGVWVNENMDQPTQIGWALIVSICGKFDWWFRLRPKMNGSQSGLSRDFYQWTSALELASVLTEQKNEKFSFRIVPWFSWRHFNSMGSIKKQQIRYKWSKSIWCHHWRNKHWWSDLDVISTWPRFDPRPDIFLP